MAKSRAACSARHTDVGVVAHVSVVLENGALMVYLLIGRRKRGKTTLALYMVRKSPRRMIFDPRGMIPTGAHAARFSTGRAFIDGGVPALEDGEIHEVIFTPDSDDLAGPFADFSGELKRWTVEHPAEPLGVLVDELGWVESARRDPPTLRRALRNCEPDIFNVYITCHRPVDVPVNTRSIVDYWALFHCVQEHDIEVIRERCNEHVAERVQRLEARSFVLFDDAEGKHREYPDCPGADGKNPWYVPLRIAADHASLGEPLSDVPSHELASPRKAPVDKRFQFD